MLDAFIDWLPWLAVAVFVLLVAMAVNPGNDDDPWDQ